MANVLFIQVGVAFFALLAIVLLLVARIRLPKVEKELSACKIYQSALGLQESTEALQAASYCLKFLASSVLANSRPEQPVVVIDAQYPDCVASKQNIGSAISSLAFARCGRTVGDIIKTLGEICASLPDLHQVKTWDNKPVTDKTFWIQRERLGIVERYLASLSWSTELHFSNDLKALIKQKSRLSICLDVGYALGVGVVGIVATFAIVALIVTPRIPVF